jgi:hypothetical protein
MQTNFCRYDKSEGCSQGRRGAMGDEQREAAHHSIPGYASSVHVLSISLHGILKNMARAGVELSGRAISCMHKALGFIPSIAKQNKTKQNKMLTLHN